MCALNAASRQGLGKKWKINGDFNVSPVAGVPRPCGFRFEKRPMTFRPERIIACSDGGPTWRASDARLFSRSAGHRERSRGRIKDHPIVGGERGETGGATGPVDTAERYPRPAVFARQTSAPERRQLKKIINKQIDTAARVFTNRKIRRNLRRRLTRRAAAKTRVRNRVANSSHASTPNSVSLGPGRRNNDSVAYTFFYSYFTGRVLRAARTRAVFIRTFVRKTYSSIWNVYEYTARNGVETDAQLKIVRA